MLCGHVACGAFLLVFTMGACHALRMTGLLALQLVASQFITGAQSGVISHKQCLPSDLSHEVGMTHVQVLGLVWVETTFCRQYWHDAAVPDLRVWLWRGVQYQVNHTEC